MAQGLASSPGDASAETRLDPGAARAARVLVTATAAFGMLVGALGLAGWLLDIELLRSGFLGGALTMKVNTTLGLCLTGAALTLLAPRARGRLRSQLGRGLALVAVLLGGLTLLEHASGLDLGIDQLLLAEPPGAPGTASPGRMGPPAAFSFLTLGLALLLLDRRPLRRGAPSQWLALAVAHVITLPLLGYITQAEQLYGIARVSGIALPSAATLFTLALGVFFARPEARPASVVLADNAGGQLARTLLPITLLTPVLLTWLRERGETLGLFDGAFGRALVLLGLIVIFTWVVWHVSVRFSSVAAARTRAERATDRAEAEAARLASENVQTLSVLDSLLAHAPIGLVFFDRTRSCVRVNDYMLRLGKLGEGLEHLGDGSWHHLDVEAVLPGRAPGLADAITRLFSGEPTDEFELVRAARPGERERVWLTGLFPVRDAQGQVSLAGAVLIDITERKRLEAQKLGLLESERKARSEAQRAADLKDEFLATLSHELRTPLNAVLGWVTVALGKPNLAPDLKRALDIVERNARLQAQLIEDLLDVSRIVSGKMRVEAQPVDLEAVLMAATAAVTPAAEGKSITLETRLDPDLEGVLGDAGRLQQVLWNLLSNAVKFTPKGGRVLLAASAFDDRVELAVSDTGAGIRTDFLPYVFDRFRQADASTTRRHGGLGLGLAIVRQLVELHGGSVAASSEGEGRGATFRVTLPRRRDVAALREIATTREFAAAQESLEGVSVLVVDDERDAREFVARVLEERRALVSTAEDVDQALEALEGVLPHVLISDIGMAGRDGYDLIRAVRERHDAAQLPAIALTAFARAEDRERTLAAGFQVHLAKPIDPRELTRAVASLLSLSPRKDREASGA